MTVDGWGKRVVIQVDEISRIRSASGHGENCSDENIVDGLLIFTDVRSILFDPPGPIPNDYIDHLEMEQLDGGYIRFKFSAASMNDAAKSREVVIIIEAEWLHLEDPAKPGLVIED